MNSEIRIPETTSNDAGGNGENGTKEPRNTLRNRGVRPGTGNRDMAGTRGGKITETVEYAAPVGFLHERWLGLFG